MNLQERDLYLVLSRIVYLIAAFVLLFWLLDEILIGIMFILAALILAVALNPPVMWLETRGMPRILGALIVSFSIGTAFMGLMALVVPRLYRDVSQLLSNLPQYLAALESFTLKRLAPYPEVQEEVREMDFEFIAEKALPAVGSVLAGAGIVSLSLVGLALFTILLSATVLFILAHPRPLLQGYLLAMPERLRDPSARAFARASDMVSRWLLSNVIVGAIEGIAAALFLGALGIPGGILWGVSTFFSEQLPKIGPYFMSIPPLIVALVIDPMKAFWVLIFYILLNEFTGLVIGPLIRSKQMKLHPASLLFAVVVMGSAFGLLGALIATPVAGIVKAYYDEFYLSRQPKDSRIDERVENMLHRRVDDVPG